MAHLIRALFPGDQQFWRRFKDRDRAAFDLSRRAKYRWLAIVIALSTLPALLQAIGVSFSTRQTDFSVADFPHFTGDDLVNHLHQLLRGSFVHSLLEWSACGTAMFTALLAVLYFQLNRDVVTPILGIALFYAGCMDAFHTLAADRIIANVGDAIDLIPFSWSIARLFTAALLLMGCGLLLGRRGKRWRSSTELLLLMVLGCGAIAYGTILYCTQSPHLPQTMYPGALIVRPWDVLPLILFAVGGLLVFPRLHRDRPTYFSWALWIGTIPQMATQLHMVFGSSALFDSDFNVAHFLKVVAYGVPLAGICASYLQINDDRNRAFDHLEAARRETEEQAIHLSELNETLAQEAVQREAAQAALEERHRALHESERRLHQKTTELEQTLNRLRDTQSQLIHTEKMSSLGRLVGGLAHEINNPVNFIHGNLVHAQSHAQDLLTAIAAYRSRIPHPDPELLALEEELDLAFIEQDFLKLLDSMGEGSRRIRQLVLALRTFSRLDEADLKVIDLHEGLDSILTLLDHRIRTPLYRQHNSALPPVAIYRCYGPLPPVECWASQINQVLMDLLINGLDAIEAAMPARIAALEGSACPIPSITIATAHCQGADGGDRVRISIHDTGTGIEASVGDRLFDPFFTTKPIGSGAGLGLSVADRVVAQHGGKLTYTSTVGEGTHFHLELPLRPQPPSASATR